jgi:hypothetical protein
VSVPSTKYTLEQLLQEGREAGFSPSERLFKDWVGLGLIDQATKRGRGRGKGIEATWPETQKDLFLSLLDKRQQVDRIAPLCNIPVALWLWWGDDYVPFRQAHRALSTWTGAYERVSWKRARWTAEQLVNQFAHPDSRRADREQLIQEIARTAYGQHFRPDEVLHLFRPVFDPHQTERSVGPPWLNARPESFVLITKVRLAAVAALRNNELKNDAFQWARQEYLQSRQEYNALQPSLASDPEASKMFLTQTPAGIYLPPTFEEIVNHACVDLLTLLGIYLDRQDRQHTDEEQEHSN